MFVYEKRLEYPIKIKNTNPKLAALIISQYGGPYTGRVRKLIFSGRHCNGLCIYADLASEIDFPANAARTLRHNKQKFFKEYKLFV